MAAVPAPALPARLGRFEIERELGRGAQGTVYLARDPHLGRAVALKTLRAAASRGRDGAAQVARLLEEARSVGRLQHPNIVALHDAGEEGGVPFLVFEYVDGQMLDAHIREHGPLEPARAATIALQVLQGLRQAHERGLLHRDVKPGNVILAKDGTARVMDFGIAAPAEAARPGEAALFGTPAFMAPEYVADRAQSASSDLYGVGLVLFEMLTGRRAFAGENVFEILHKVASQPLPAPSSLEPAVPEMLDSIVATATARRPDERYPDCAAMIEALRDWLEPGPAPGGEGEGGRKATVAFLLRRMRHKSDLPALSSTIGAINQVVSSEDEHTSVLCNSILRDVSLTGKLLKVVNAAYYQQFGGSVSTISRAVAILGFTRIRNTALSLVLFEHLQNKAQAAHLKDEVAAAYLSGVIAAQLVEKGRISDAEEAFICAMFHHLGRLLVGFYLHEEAEAIARLAQSKAVANEAAALQVLGVSYADLGQGVAREWNLPDMIVRSMRPLDDPLPSREAFDRDKLRAIADFSSRLTALVRDPREDRRLAGIRQVAASFGGALPVSEAGLRSLVRDSVETLASDLDFVGSGVASSALVANAREWGGVPQRPEPAPAGEAAQDDETLADRTLVELTLVDEAPPPAASGADEPDRRRRVLTAGVQDITDTLVSEYRLNDVLPMILETIYRGIGFKRVLLLVRDNGRSVLRARYGFGADVERLLAEGFSIPLGATRDVFSAAIGQGVDICIEDRDAENIRRHVPGWYVKAIAAHGLVLFPVSVKKRVVALIYADADGPGPLRYAPEELNLLRTLRNQAALAIMHRA